MSRPMPKPPMVAVDSPRTGADPSVRDLSGQWYATMGIDRRDAVELDTSPATFAELATEEPWVYIAIQRMVQDVQQVPIYCYAKKGKNRVLPDDNSRDHRQADIQYLLDNVNNSTMQGADLRAWHLISDLIWGEDYWHKLRGRYGGPPQELNWLRPANVEPIVQQGQITGYRYTGTSTGLLGDTGVRVYDPADVIAYRTPNPRDPSHGLSFLQAVKYDISVDRQAAQWNAYTLANWGVPAVAWVAPQGANISPAERGLIQRTLAAMRKVKNRGRSAILPEGLEPKVLSLNPKDAEWTTARKVARMTISAAAGIPLVLAGDDDKNTVYGNLRDAERIYWRGTLIPKLDRWGDCLTNWLLPDFGSDARDAYVIAPDYTAVHALRPELTQEMNAWAGLIDRETIVPNEARRHFAIGADVEWGDDPLRSTKLISEPPDELPPGAPQVEVGVVSQIPTAATEAAVVPMAPPGAPAPASAPVPAPGPAAPAAGPAPAARENPLPRNLYRHPAVKAWLADTTSPIGDVAAALGVAPSDALRVGLQRRYSSEQLWNGYARGGFAGIRETA